MRKKMSKKAIAISLTATLVLGGAGAAFAWWSSTASVEGTAATATNAEILKIAANNDVTGLQPGGSAYRLTGTLLNETTGTSTWVTSISAEITSLIAGPDTPAFGADGACLTSDYVLGVTGDASLSGLVATFPVRKEIAYTDGTTTVPWGDTADHATVAFDYKASNQDQCKGATVNITYTYK
jgi:hypothetical protein